MKSLLIAVTVLVVALALPVEVTAQSTRYKLIDLGTFGGPNSFLPGQFPPAQDLNNGGTVAGAADTTMPDPNCFFDCFVFHAFRWQNGHLTDLGVLPGGSVSSAVWISASGLILGNADNGEIDPLTHGLENRGVLWKHGQITNLGTLGGNNSFPSSVNNGGQVVGGAANAIPDPYPVFIGAGQQSRAFLWQNGAMEDLGTLGGPDAAASFVNDRGQIAGVSFTDSTANASTGLPTIHPFLWQNGIMQDLGSFGGLGSMGNFSNGISPEVNHLNSRGEVAGTSPLAGDQTYHAFLWNGTLTDLGTLGGDNSKAYWVNDAGDVVGEADLPGSQTHDAFLWKNGVMTDLGSVGSDPCSNAYVINSKGQIVGESTNCHGVGLHAFLWQNGGPMIDLNTFVPPGADLQVHNPVYINDRGEITAIGLLPSGDQHAVLLIPCGEGTEGCRDAAQSADATAESRAAGIINSSTIIYRGMAAWRVRLAQQYHIPGLETPSD